MIWILAPPDDLAAKRLERAAKRGRIADPAKSRHSLSRDRRDRQRFSGDDSAIRWPHGPPRTMPHAEQARRRADESPRVLPRPTDRPASGKPRPHDPIRRSARGASRAGKHARSRTAPRRPAARCPDRAPAGGAENHRQARSARQPNCSIAVRAPATRSGFCTCGTPGSASSSSSASSFFWPFVAP